MKKKLVVHSFMQARVQYFSPFHTRNAAWKEQKAFSGILVHQMVKQ